MIGRYSEGLKTIESKILLNKTHEGVLFRRLENRVWSWNQIRKERTDNKYVGEISNGVPNGQGTYTFFEGHKYVGEFKDGEMNGKGIFKWSNGDRFEGEFSNGFKNRKGTFYFFQYGRKGIGEWKNGKKWNVTYYDGNNRIVDKYVYGKRIQVMN